MRQFPLVCALALSACSKQPSKARPLDMSMAQDLAPDDLSVASDLSATPDLTAALDFSGTPDLTPLSDLTAAQDLTPADDLSLPSSTLSVSLTGVGSIASTPSGIICPTTNCSASFPTGDSLELDATGSFKAWGAGPCSGTVGSSCTFTLSSGSTQAAAFYAAGGFASTTRVTAADTAALNPASVTVEAWAVITSTSEPNNNSRVTIVRKGGPFSGTPTGYSLGYFYSSPNFKAEFAVVDGSLFGCDSPSALSAGVHALAGEYDATTGNIALYVDGTLVCSGTEATNAITSASGSALTFGAPSGDANPFVGTIDEVRISNASRYSANYTASSVRHPTADATTVGLWHFDEGSGTTIGDSSTTGANATAGGTGFTFVAEP